MIALSSIRPHKNSEVYRANQIRAKESWEKVFSDIVYFSPKEPELDSPKTIWIESEEWPSIKTLAAYGGRQKDISAIINSDIVVSPELAKVELLIRTSSIMAATSRRWDLDQKVILDNDKGRDIFIAKPKAWRMLAAEISSTCRIGHNQWDSWALVFFQAKFIEKFADFSRCKCIFHPKHGERNQPYVDEVDISGPYQGFQSGRFDTIISL